MRLLAVIVSIQLDHTQLQITSEVCTLKRPRLSLVSECADLGVSLGRLPPDVHSNWDYRRSPPEETDFVLSLSASPSVSRLLAICEDSDLGRRTSTAIDGRVMKFHGFSVPPSALRRSKVSHQPRLSMREKPGFVSHFRFLLPMLYPPLTPRHCHPFLGTIPSIV